MSWRYTREAAPFRATIVAGTPTFEMGKGYTGALPGVMLSPGQVSASSRAAD